MLLLTACIPAHEDLAAIQSERLPQTASVLSAFDDAQQLEPYTDHWSSNWDYPVAKQTVANRLGMYLGILKAAVKEHPDNEELLLLTALVAHYAYNVDADNAQDLVLQSLIEAAKLRPSDIRPEWFRADFLCQTDDPVPGANAFLALEATHQRQDLPAGFWDDYLACALVTNMPAHVLRAADNLAEIHAASNHLRTSYTNLARERFVSVDPSKTYDAKQAWYSTPAGSDWDFTSTACGLRFRVRANWRTDRLEVQEGVCAVVFSTGPYKAQSGPLSPEIFIIVRRPEDQETLADFLRRFTQKGTFKSATPLHCPSTACLAMNGFQPGVYGKDGDSLPRVVALEQDQPQYPGLLFESPEGPPTSPSTSGVQYFRPDQTLQRMPGKLYYLIGLDTASSIEPQAVRDFEFFLQHVQVE
jgi:hypothetical protein